MQELNPLPDSWKRMFPLGVSVDQISSDYYDEGQGSSFLIEHNEKEIYVSFYFQDNGKSWIRLQFCEHGVSPDMTGFDEFALYDLPRLLNSDSLDLSYSRRRAKITVVADGVEFNKFPKSKKYYLDELMDEIEGKEIDKILYEFPISKKQGSEMVQVRFNNDVNNDMGYMTVAIPLFCRGMIDQTFMENLFGENDDGDSGVLTASNIANTIQILCDYQHI